MNLDRIMIPHTVSRKYLNINKTSTWKASEMRQFFLHIDVPILKHFLNPVYFWNLCNFVYGKEYFIKKPIYRKTICIFQ